MPSTLMAGFLYLGAGLGMIVLLFFRKAVRQSETESHLSRQDLYLYCLLVSVGVLRTIVRENSL